MKNLVLILLTILLFSCSNNSKSQPNEQSSNIGLDLVALNEIVKNSRTADEIEQKINTPDGINNVDLDDDGNVDYIRVVGYSNPVYGYEFRAITNDGSEHYITKIDFDKNAGVIRTTGNPVYYTTNNYYETPYHDADWLILAWLFYHPVYKSLSSWLLWSLLSSLSQSFLCFLFK